MKKVNFKRDFKRVEVNKTKEDQRGPQRSVY